MSAPAEEAAVPVKVKVWTVVGSDYDSWQLISVYASEVSAAAAAAKARESGDFRWVDVDEWEVEA